MNNSKSSIRSLYSRTVSAFFRVSLLFFVVGAFAVCAVAAQEEIPGGQPAADEIRFVAVGDTGNGNEGQRAVAAQMRAAQEKSRFGLILFLGDNIYRSGEPKDFGEKFALPYRSFIENGTELRGVIGNHDARSEAGVLLQQLMFEMGGKTFYSFAGKAGAVEFFALDSNPLIKTGTTPAREAQLAWLDRRLGESRAKWKIVFLHHSLYSSAKKHGWNSSDADEMENVRRAVEPLLVKHGVKVVLSGHDHVYERVRPQQGVYHFTAGAGSEVRAGSLQPASPFYEFGNDRELSFMLFSVRPDAIRFWAVNVEGRVFDDGKIR